MKLRVGQTRLQIDLALLLMPLIAALLGEGAAAAVLMVSLAAHEAAHLAVARCAGLSVPSVRLTPFGGAIRLENPYAAPPGRVALTAAAGPAANLLLTVLSAALCQWMLLPPALCALCLQTNALLMLFNLLPALPMDGGRILCALLSLRMDRGRAQSLCVLLGRIVAIALAALSLWGWLACGRLNLSPLFAAVFLWVSAGDEREAMADGRVRAMLQNLQPLRAPIRADLIAVDASTEPAAALRAARPGRVPLFAVFQGSHLTRLTDAQSLLNKLAEAREET